MTSVDIAQDLLRQLRAFGVEVDIQEGMMLIPIVISLCIHCVVLIIGIFGAGKQRERIFGSTSKGRHCLPRGCQCFVGWRGVALVEVLLWLVLVMNTVASHIALSLAALFFGISRLCTMGQLPELMDDLYTMSRMIHKVSEKVGVATASQPERSDFSADTVGPYCDTVRSAADTFLLLLVALVVLWLSEGLLLACLASAGGRMRQQIASQKDSEASVALKDGITTSRDVVLDDQPSKDLAADGAHAMVEAQRELLSLRARCVAHDEEFQRMQATHHSELFILRARQAGQMAEIRELYRNQEEYARQKNAQRSMAPDAGSEKDGTGIWTWGCGIPAKTPTLRPIDV